MTQEQFIYWLRGFMSGKDYISAQDILLLKEQLDKVISHSPYSSPVMNPTHEFHIKGPRDYSTMPMFT